jgi:hypothetical protein
MLDLNALARILPLRVRNALDAHWEAFEVVRQIHNPRVLMSLAPAAVRGLVLRRGKQGVPTRIQASHVAHFDWGYPDDQPEMRRLYEKAKRGQWDSASLAWSTDVDPLNPEVPLLPERFLDFPKLESMGVKLGDGDRRAVIHDVMAWSLSQFLHGEQGALFAAAQVTEAVQFFDGKLYGATQVMDEGRHVEVFHRYVVDKLGKLYPINDNLFVIIDALMSDSRWDMKFLGMQIMVEGLALGAFGTIYKLTKEPLLKQILRMVIQDEARHVHYGILALREHITKELSEGERREREDWAFEVALLMRDRFMMYELYEDRFQGALSRAQWRDVVAHSPGLGEFRTVMFNRLVPNLRQIGLLSPRIAPHYAAAGLMKYVGGAAGDTLTGDEMIRELDQVA